MIFMYIKGKLATKIKAGRQSFQAFVFLFVFNTQKTFSGYESPLIANITIKRRGQVFVVNVLVVFELLLLLFIILLFLQYFNIVQFHCYKKEKEKKSDLPIGHAYLQDLTNYS